MFVLPVEVLFKGSVWPALCGSSLRLGCSPAPAPVGRSAEAGTRRPPSLLCLPDTPISESRASRHCSLVLTPAGAKKESRVGAKEMPATVAEVEGQSASALSESLGFVWDYAFHGKTRSPPSPAGFREGILGTSFKLLCSDLGFIYLFLLL